MAFRYILEKTLEKYGLESLKLVSGNDDDNDDGNDDMEL